jgi:hypothetical protein
MQRSRAFYVSFFLPWLETNNVSDSSPQDWFCDAFAEIDKSPDAEADWRSNSHWKMYCAFYDLIRSRREIREGKYEQARALMYGILSDPVWIPNEQLAEARDLLGQIEVASGDRSDTKGDLGAAPSIRSGDADWRRQDSVAVVRLGRSDCRRRCDAGPKRNWNSAMRLRCQWRRKLHYIP